MSDLPGFRWLPGMLADDGHRVVRVVNGVAVRAGGVIGAVVGPDWTDPLTALGLLVLVREAQGVGDKWAITTTFNAVTLKWGVLAVEARTGNAVSLSAGHSTETEALKAALAAAPRKGQ